MRFDELNISEKIKNAVADMGFEEATPIQSKAIPIVLDGKDVIGQSQTGTGKTAAFGIPILEKIDTKLNKTQSIILCPTRELAVQICEELKRLAKYLDGIKISPVYGGQPINVQIQALRKGVHVIVGTPGRVMDHMRRKTIKLEHINSVILDEADEMLNMGFREDIETILEGIEQEKQMILFSATMPKSILALTKKFQDKPIHIKIAAKQLTTSTITQTYYDVKDKYKMEALTRLIDVNKPKLSLVFCNTKRKVDELTDELHTRGYACDKLHGDMNQNVRLNVLNKFNRGAITILIATDVAARGIDIDDIEAVFNYDVPENEEYYVHRIGRTGRAGRAGYSYTFVGRGEQHRLRNIMSYTKKKIDKSNVPSIEDVNKSRINSFVDKMKVVLEAGKLDKYSKIVEDVAAQDYSPEQIAAALLKMQIDLSEKKDLEFSSPASSRKTQNTRSTRGNAGSEKGMTRLYINAGKKHNIQVRDILGAVAGEADICGSEIGLIDMYDKYSFVEVPERHTAKILDVMNKKKIKGKQITMEISSKKPRRSNTRHK